MPPGDRDPPPLHEVRIEPLTAAAFAPFGRVIATFLLNGACSDVLHVGTWHSLDRHPLAPPTTTYLMISDHETQADLVASCAGHGRWALTQEIDLERDCGAAVERVP